MKTNNNGTLFSEEQLLKLFKDIEEGKVVIDCVNNFSNSIIQYRTNNNYFISVFDDSGYWDYIDNIQRGSKKITHTEIVRFMPELSKYKPSVLAAEKIYKLKTREE